MLIVVHQILSFIAKNEKETMRKRQAEGIRMGKLNGVKLGRPSVAIPDDFVSIISLYKKGVINSKEAIEKSGLARGTFLENFNYSVIWMQVIYRLKESQSHTRIKEIS